MSTDNTNSRASKPKQPSRKKTETIKDVVVDKNTGDELKRKIAAKKRLDVYAAMAQGDLTQVTFGSSVVYVNLAAIRSILTDPDTKEPVTLSVNALTAIEFICTPWMMADASSFGRVTDEDVSDMLGSPAVDFLATNGVTKSLATHIVQLCRDAVTMARLAHKLPRVFLPVTTSLTSTDQEVMPWSSWPGHQPGLHVLAGSWFSGKSHKIAEMGADFIIRVGEPTEHYDAEGFVSDGPTVIHSRSMAGAIFSSLLVGYAGYKVAVDSLRELLFNMSGAATTGGIAASVYSFATSYNNLCAQMGTLVVAALNPMVTDQKAESVYNAVASSVAGITVLDEAIAYTSYRTASGRVLDQGGNTTTIADEEAVPVVPVGPRYTPDVKSVPSELVDPDSVDIPDDEIEPETTRGIEFRIDLPSIGE